LKPAFRRVYKWFIAITVIGVILLAILYLFRSTLVAPYIQGFMEDSIESQLGIRLNVAAVGGSYFKDLVVTNVTTVKPDPGGPLVALELKRLRVAYNLWSLLKGIDAFLAAAAIELDGASLKIDLSPRPETSQVPPKSDLASPIFMPDRLPTIRIRDTSVLLQGAGYRTAFIGVELHTVDARPTASTLQLRMLQWSWNHPNLQGGQTPVSAVIEYSRDHIAIKNLTLAEQQMAESVQVGLKDLPESLTFNANLSLTGGQAALDGKLDHSDLVARLNVEHVDIARLISILKPPGPRLTGMISLKADLGLPIQQPSELTADLDLKLTGANLYGLAADELDLKAAAKDGQMRLEKLDLRTGENLIEFRDVSSASQAVFGGDVEAILQTLAGGFAFDCRDVPAFFSLAGVDLSSQIDTVPAHRLKLDGEIGGGDIIISGGSLTTDGGHIRLDPSRIALPSMNRPISDTAIQAALDIDLPDLELIGRLFKIPQLGGSVQGHATASGTLGAPGGTATIAARGIAFEDVTYGDLKVKASADSQAATIESVTLQRGNDRLTGRGRFHFVNQEFEDVQLEFRLADLAYYTAKFWPKNWNLARGKPRIGGSLAGKVTLNGPLAMPGGTADIKAQQLSFEENHFGNADIRLNSNGQKITVETLVIRQAKDRVALQGSFDLKSQLLENAKLDIAIADFAAYTKNLLPETQPLTAAVHANLKISGPLQEPEARADIRLKEVQLNGVNITSAVFKLKSSGRRIHIDLAQVNAPLGEAKLAGNLMRGKTDAEFDLELTDLTLSGQEALLALKKPGHIHFTRKGDVSLKNISLGGPNGDIRLKGSLTAQKKADFDLSISDFNSNGWFESLATDRVRFSGLNAHIHLFGTMNAPSVTVKGDLPKFNSPRDQISLSGRFDLSYTKDGITIRQFQWQGRPGQLIAVTATIPVNLFEKPFLRPGPLSVDARISIPDLTAFNFYFPDYIPSDGNLEGKLQMAGNWQAPSGTFNFRIRGLNDPPHLKSMPPGPIDVDGNIRLDVKKLVVESIQINSPRLRFTSRGEWTGMPALTELFQGEIAKPTGNVALKGNLNVEDLSWLAAENPSLRRVAGRLAADVTMKGAVSDPAIDAVVRLTDGELRPDMDVPSLQALNLNAVVTPAGARLQTFTGELGGAPFQITGSVMRNSDSGATSDLRLQGENLLFFRSEGLKVRADTDLTVKGPLKRLKVAGEVAITDGRLVKYFDLLGTLKGSSKPKTDIGLQLFSIRQPPLSDMIFDVRLTSKNPFTIRNNLAKGAVRPELKLIGTGKLPVLAGEVYLDPTRISLPAGSLFFESGVIRFDPNRPDRPTLDLVGTSRMLGYDITMLVEGPYDEPVVTLSSVPPLSNQELLLLLITGQQPNTADDSQASQRQNMNVAVFLGRDLIARWFGSDSVEASESIIDRFDVHIGRAVTRSGEETIEAQFRIAEGVLRDGDKLYLTGEKDIWDFYNAGLKIVFRFK
jgi:autotransporter translocation and assembly factor TamB